MMSIKAATAQVEADYAHPSSAVPSYEHELRLELTRDRIPRSDPLHSVLEHALNVPGKLTRPTLLIESALAVGGAAGDVLPAAVGTEFGHVASLIHDDIIDHDDERRGQPAVHARYGVDTAIVAGDALIFQLFRCLAECRKAGVADDRIVTALEILADCGKDLCRGQQLETEIGRRRLRSLHVYLEMIELKTAALFSGACRSGAVLAGGREEWVRALGTYGSGLGIAFQIWDDLLPYVGDPAATGKPAASDLRNRRLTLPILLAYRNGGLSAAEVLDAALDGEITDDITLEAAVRAVEDVLRTTGAIDASADMARGYAATAKQVLEVLPPSASRDRLAGLADRAVDRVS
ncbi:polyprenyl synthetase family protein [Lentzea sp. NPDC004782]|uniref:polyprenyl synthetase family protein n=1 Tax=Lentzea sp. NPDC004782 TaxID=3154458 RepID=UPI0033A5DCAA